MLSEPELVIAESNLVIFYWIVFVFLLFHFPTYYKATITVGYLLTPLLQSRYDCKNISAVFLLLMSLSMMMMGLSFTYPAMSMLTIPSLVVSGVSYGLGVGPAPPILTSTLFPQNMKSTGITIGQVVRALVNTIQFKVGIFFNKERK